MVAGIEIQLKVHGNRWDNVRKGLRTSIDGCSKFTDQYHWVKYTASVFSAQNNSREIIKADLWSVQERKKLRRKETAGINYALNFFKQ